MNRFGSHSMVERLRRVMICAPSPSIGSVDADLWHYAGAIDADRAGAEFSAFASLLRSHGCEIVWIDGASAPELADAMFAHDASLVTRHGAVLARMGKPLRRGEERLHARRYEGLGVPILGAIEAPGTLEGGDCLWLDDNLLAVGQGLRTNAEGIEQLRSILGPRGVDIERFDLPVHRGSAACLHLMSLVSLLDRSRALVAAPLMPAGLDRLLAGLGIARFEAPWDEFEQSNTISANILAVAPGVCLMVGGFPKTRALLEGLGCRVECFEGEELCVKAEGGPTCLTRPLWRCEQSGEDASGRTARTRG